MELKTQKQIDAPLEKVWDIIGPNYTSAGDWASSVYASGARPGTPKVADAPAADDARHMVSYSASGAKMPGFMKGGHILN